MSYNSNNLFSKHFQPAKGIEQIYFDSRLKNLAKGLAENSKSTVVATPNSAKAFILALLTKETNGKIAVVTPTENEALALKDDLATFLNLIYKEDISCFVCPERLGGFHSGIIPDPVSASKRLAALYRMQNPPFIMIASAKAFMQKTLPLDVFQKRVIKISKNMTIDLDKLKLLLVESGYTREVNVETRGSFAVRGGIIDIFSPSSTYPVRIDFMGDTVDTVRFFNPETQLTMESLQDHTYDIIPAKEIIKTPETTDLAKLKFRELADGLDIPKTKRKSISNLIEGDNEASGLEFLLPLFYEHTNSILDFAGDDTTVFQINSAMIKRLAREHEEKEVFRFKEGIEQERFSAHPDLIFIKLQELFKKIRMSSTICFEDFYIEDKESQRIDFDSEQIGPFTPDTGTAKQNPSRYLIEILKSNEDSKLKTFIFFENQASREKIQGLLKQNRIDFEEKPKPKNDASPTQSKGITFVEGRLGKCFDIKSLSVSFIDEISLFEKKRTSHMAQSKPLSISDISELKNGDFVVHADHGIARYDGLVNLSIRGVDGDFLILTYGRDDKLYLPVYRMDLVHKYIGADSRKPKLSRLGSTSWEKTKSRIARVVMGMAHELVKLYAQRKIVRGFAFSGPDDTYRSFESLFPYVETPDQINALEDVLRDMESSRPMDRLICGDVGYGKTEIALRATYKAAMDGKQVAMLVPTTVLAQQHFETFRKRFENYPVNIDFLSRFKTKKQQKRSLEKIKNAETNVIIGTHRLLSEDVKFRDLGLLIIDEEHRFGVNHKEKIKKYRNKIDVLALSATPIPRSLEMSLVGLRDLSIINTPPADRKAVRTFIARYDKALIKDTIQRELERGGQVFFMHNRIETIESVYRELKKLLPEAKTCIAHGRMREEALSEVMLKFLNRKYDVLLSTAIIESGLDIPNANTIFINRADTLGLAQLYQLRGRVGRSKELAYAYLLIPPEEILTTDAGERLKALKNFTELGSGLKVALRDLEIRGAGNLFGQAQSGHIASIGLEMYTKILEKTVAKLKGETTVEEYQPELKVNIDAFIQDSYVSNIGQRLAYYKRLSHAGSDEEISSIAEELRDRFGPIPRRLEMLLMIASVKIAARKLKAKEIFIDRKTVAFKLPETHEGSPSKIVQALKNGQIFYSGGGKIKLNIQESDPARRLLVAKKMLLKLA